MTRFLIGLDRIERILIALLAGTALLLACFAMTGRYILPAMRLDWTFEVTIFAMIWATFLAGARTAGLGEHVRVDTLLTFLPRRIRLALAIFACIFGVAVALFLLWSGVIVVEEGHRWGERTTSSLRLPMWIYYLSLPVGAALLAFHLVVRAAGLVAGTVSDEAGELEH